MPQQRSQRAKSIKQVCVNKSVSSVNTAEVKIKMWGDQLASSYFFFLFPASKFPLQRENWKILYTQTYYNIETKKQIIPPKITVNIVTVHQEQLNTDIKIKQTNDTTSTATQLYTRQNDKSFHISDSRRHLEELQHKNGGKLKTQLTENNIDYKTRQGSSLVVAAAQLSRTETEIMKERESYILLQKIIIILKLITYCNVEYK